MTIKLFITGTDTSIGKTTFCAHFARELCRRDLKVHVLKPVETGCKEQLAGKLIAADAHELWQASSQTQAEDDVCVYRFGPPVAPAVAAEMAEQVIALDRLDDAVKQQGVGADVLLIEGAGGLLVPLNQSCSFADWATRLKVPVVVVVGSRLGVLNHALLTFEVLHSRGIPVLGYVFNDLFRADVADESISSNRQTLAEHAKRYSVRELAYLPCLDLFSANEIELQFQDIADRILQHNQGLVAGE